jgi:GntP family gluconate:H+ symporter
LLLALGLAVVLGGILWLRLHPFLALILGAFAVGGLTGADHLTAAMEAKFRGELTRSAIRDEVVREILSRKDAGEAFDVQEIRGEAKREVRERSDEIEATASVKATDFTKDNTTLSRLIAAFGSICGKIGLLIAMACVIGRCLLASGAAERIVRSALSLVGERGAPLAFSGSSFVLGIPVFFDSVFLLSIPLAKATWLKTRKNYLFFIAALLTGGTMTHSLVPPTPGPLFVAEELGVNIGTMILVGLTIGIFCSAAGLLYAWWLNRRMEIPVRETEEEMSKLEELSLRKLSELPPLWISLLPILLPVVLISAATIYKGGLDPTESASSLSILGDKNVALMVAAAAAMILASVRLGDRKALAEQVQQAMQEAGLIILICCAGGAFGAMLQQSGIGPHISGMTGDNPLDYGLLPLAFLITAVIRGAQGSATVAMFTGVAIIGGLAPDLGNLSYHPAYLAAAIGCGSKPFAWMNDSGFWVVSKMSGMTEKETLQVVTPLLTLMGFTGILVTMIAAKVIPLVP